MHFVFESIALTEQCVCSSFFYCFILLCRCEWIFFYRFRFTYSHWFALALALFHFVRLHFSIVIRYANIRNKGKVECWCNEQNLRSLYPSYVNNNISRTPTVFTTILLIDEGILWVFVWLI